MYLAQNLFQLCESIHNNNNEKTEYVKYVMRWNIYISRQTQIPNNCLSHSSKQSSEPFIVSRLADKDTFHFEMLNFGSAFLLYYVHAKSTKNQINFTLLFRLSSAEPSRTSSTIDRAISIDVQIS